jgi:hypothetical protein
MPETGYETKPPGDLQLHANLQQRPSLKRYLRHAVCREYRFAKRYLSLLKRQSFTRKRVSKPLVFRFLQRGWLRAIPPPLLAWMLSASACGAPAPNNAPVFGTGVFHPPPKPGGSISHTQMCECKVCDPASCCDGPEDDPPATHCGDSYDFSADSACGISVRSCASRCTREIWRVRAGAPCAEKRPQSCCQAG